MFGTRAKLATAVAIVGAVGVTGAAVAGNGGKNFKANLSGFEEVPAISTTGGGKFKAQVNRAGTEIRYTLTYRDLEGGSPTAAHIHFAQKSVNGDVSAFLCGGGSKPPCPASPGSISGLIVASDVIGPANKGIAPGEIAELIRAMRAGVTYANVHTPTYPTGEIRGQIGRGGGGGDNGDGDSDSDD